MPIPAYSEDITGVSPANLISNEIHVLSVSASGNYLAVIPTYAPFFYDSVVVVHRNIHGVATTLTRDVDYHGAFEFLSASRALSKRIYGGISVLDVELTGNLEITYQTLGGTWMIDLPKINAILSDTLRNPRTLSWEQVTEIQELFPPDIHQDPLEDTKGQEELIAAIDDLSWMVAVKRGVVEDIQLALTPANTPLSAGIVSAYARAPFDLRIHTVRVALDKASTSGDVVVDLKVSGVSILSRQIRIPQGQRTSKAAALQPLFSRTDINDDEEFRWEIIETGTGAEGLNGTVLYVPRPTAALE